MKNKIKLKQLYKTIIILALIVSFCYITYRIAFSSSDRNDYPDAFVNIMNMLITAIGLLFVALEMDESGRIKSCDMMAQMNIEFMKNNRLMTLYSKLDAVARRKEEHIIISDDSNPQHIHTEDLVAYFTMYEVIYTYLKNGITSIQEINDLFSDRFFKFIHNKEIQMKELFAVEYSYINIFELYKEWITYKEKNNECIPLIENRIPEEYLNKIRDICEMSHYSKEELPKKKRDNPKGDTRDTTNYDIPNKENIPTFNKPSQIQVEYRPLYSKNIYEFLKLQEEATKDTTPEIFAKTTEYELIESIVYDYVYGLFCNNKLIAACICVSNRKTPRNLCNIIDKEDRYDQYITFDTIFVHPDFWGYGIQDYFLKKAENYAKIQKATALLATVSSSNNHSFDNFINAKYMLLKGDVLFNYGTYDNNLRNIMMKELKENKSTAKK